jgi:hypothetical protein
MLRTREVPSLNFGPVTNHSDKLSLVFFSLSRKIAATLNNLRISLSRMRNEWIYISTLLIDCISGEAIKHEISFHQTL